MKWAQALFLHTYGRIYLSCIGGCYILYIFFIGVYLFGDRIWQLSSFFLPITPNKYTHGNNHFYLRERIP